ncbi:MAG: hypothetical protein PHP64_06460 [Actinomycetota bacterium]|nr:hypothetical protein [Actinomycetota bacterium]
MQTISLSEPCFTQKPGTDVQHLPLELCKKLFGWDSACQSIEIMLRNRIPNVEFYAVVAVESNGMTLAARGELGRHHYFIPWSNVIAIHGHIAT